MAVADLNAETGKIEVRGSGVYTGIPGSKRRADGTWEMPATLDTCTALKNLKVDFSDALSVFGNKQWKIQKYIEHVKLQTEKVEPLQPIPIKAPYSLYQHQVKAYNIALALFGRGARKAVKP